MGRYVGRSGKLRMGVIGEKLFLNFEPVGTDTTLLPKSIIFFPIFFLSSASAGEGMVAKTEYVYAWGL